MADPPTPEEGSGLTENSTLALVFWTIVFFPVLMFGTFGVEESTGISAVAIWAGVALLGVILAVPERTRVFGLACLIAVTLESFFILLAVSQVA